MRYDPTEPTPEPSAAPKPKRAPKPENPTKAMQDFAGLTDAMIKLMAFCEPIDVARTRAEFTEYLRMTGATNWRDAWSEWRRSHQTPQSQAPSPTLQVVPSEPATCNLPPEPVPSAPFPLCPPAATPPPTHPWLARFQRRRQLGLGVREPGTLAIA